MFGQLPLRGGWVVLGVAPGVAEPWIGVVGDDVGADVLADPLVLDELVAARVCALVAADELAAKATPVPTPARTPVSMTPAIACLVRSFMSFASLLVASGATRDIVGPWPSDGLWNRSAVHKKIASVG